MGLFLKVGLSVALVMLLARGSDFDDLAARIRAMRSGELVFAIALVALTPLLTAMRWRCGCHAFGFTMPLKFLVRSTYAAIFVGQFLPSGVGVDSARLGLLWRAKVSLTNAAGSIACDRFAGIGALVALACLGLPALPVPISGRMLASIGAAVTLVVLCGAAAFTFGPRLTARLRRWPWMERLGGLLIGLRRALLSRDMAPALGYGLLIHLLCNLAILALARSVGQALEFWPLLSITSIAVFASLLPISFNGWGVREGALVLGLSLLHVPKEASLLISVVYGIALAVASLPGALFILGGPSRPVEYR